VEAEYHKRVEQIHQQVDRLRFHAATTARALQYDRDLADQAFEHMEQALENLRRAYELGKQARSRPNEDRGTS
jgi:uncharacterized protein YaaN involved in tellurite resistance